MQKEGGNNDQEILSLLPLMSELDRKHLVGESQLFFGCMDIGRLMNYNSHRMLVIEMMMMLCEDFPDWKLSLESALPWPTSKKLIGDEIKLYRGTLFDDQEVDKGEAVEMWLTMLDNMGIKPIHEEMTIRNDQLQRVVEVVLPLFARGRALLEGLNLKPLEPPTNWKFSMFWKDVLIMLNEVGKSKVDKHWGQTFWELWEAGDIRIMSAIAIRRKMAQSQREIKLGYNDDGTSNAQRKLLDDREQSASAKLNSNPAFNDGDDFENLEMIVGLEDTKFESKNNSKIIFKAWG